MAVPSTSSSSFSSPSRQHERVLALLPKISGGLSLLFSLFLAVHVLRDYSQRSLCYQRLMLAVALADMSASLWMGLSTWPIPRGQAVWAVGNETTCRVQAFFVQGSILTSCYSASLSVFFWLVIVKQWNEDKLRRVEWLLHGIPLLWAGTTGFLALYLDSMEAAGLWCWISSDWQSLRWSVFYFPLWVMISIVTVCCSAIFLHVRRLNVQVRQHSQIILVDTVSRTSTGGSIKEGDEDYEEIIAVAGPSSDDAVTSQNNTDETENNSPQVTAHRQSRRIQQVAEQCFLYAFAFYFNWASLTAVRLIQALDRTVPFGLAVVSAATVPMQGLPNFLVYIRPKLMRARKRSGQARWLPRFMATHSRADLTRAMPGPDPPARDCNGSESCCCPIDAGVSNHSLAVEPSQKYDNAP